MSDSTYRIIYPNGNRSDLEIFEVCSGMEYELEDFDLASERTLYSYDEAVEYARDLARRHGKELRGMPAYLDEDYPW